MSFSASEVVRTTTGMRGADRILLHLAQHLAPVLAGQVEVEQDQVRRRRFGVGAFAARKAIASTPSVA